MNTAMKSRLSPYLGVHDAEAAIRFYTEAFGAREVGERYPWEGKIGHAELELGDAMLCLADEFPEYNTTPVRLGGSPVMLHLEVDDTDATAASAAQLGAEITRPPEDNPYGRTCTIRDPFGHIWMLEGPNKE